MASSSRYAILPGLLCVALLPAALAPALGFAAIAAHGSGARTAAPQGYLGIMFHDVADGSVATLHLKDKHGAEIIMVDHDGPAGKAGLREHDVILSLNGTAVQGEDQLRRMLHEMQPGRTIILSVSRDGTERTLSAVLSTREEVVRQAKLQRWTVPVPTDDVAPEVPAPEPPPRGSMFSRSFMSGHLLSLTPTYTGATVDALGAQLAEYFGVKDGDGLLIHMVEGNSPAASAGLRAGDVVTRMNGNRVVSEKDWNRALHESKGRAITLTVVRDRREQTLTMVAESHKRSFLEEPHTGGEVSPLLMLR